MSAFAASGLAVAAALALAAAPASAAARPDYSVTIAPASIAGGSTGLTMTATITDETLLQPVQVVALSWPGAVQVTGASLPTGYPAPIITTCASAGGPTPCIQLRRLGLRPHRSVVLTMTVNTPPACANVVGSWHVVARSDLLFTLINLLLGGGGSLNLDPASQLTTTVTDSCKLQFDQGPADTVVGQTITGTPFTPSGPALTVGVVDQNGLPVALSGVPVTMGLNATAGALGGTTMETTSGGVATFDKLSVNAAANSDTLTASASYTPAIASGTSGPFNVVSAAVSCTSNPCDLSATSGTNSLAVTSGATSGTLQGSILSGTLGCTGYPSQDLQLDPNTYQVLASSTSAFSKDVTISFQPVSGSGAPVVSADQDFGGTGPDEQPGQLDFDDVLWRSDVCFQATDSFTTKAGTPAASQDPTTGLWTGLLPDCPSDPTTATEPCHDRASDTVNPIGATGSLDYTINLHVHIPASFVGDPRMN